MLILIIMQFPLYCEAIPLSGVFEDLDEDVSGEVQQLTDTVTHTTHTLTPGHYSIVYMDQNSHLTTTALYIWTRNSGLAMWHN